MSLLDGIYKPIKERRAMRKLLVETEDREKEKIRRREFCVERAAWACDERPQDIIRIAEQLYEWIYGEKP